MANKVHQYVPDIKNGLPPSRVKTTYDMQISEGELIRIGERIDHGQYVENLSAGSLGRIARIVKTRGLAAVRRLKQGESRGPYMSLNLNG